MFDTIQKNVWDCEGDILELKHSSFNPNTQQSEIFFNENLEMSNNPIKYFPNSKFHKFVSKTELYKFVIILAMFMFGFSSKKCPPRNFAIFYLFLAEVSFSLTCLQTNYSYIQKTTSSHSKTRKPIKTSRKVTKMQ